MKKKVFIITGSRSEYGLLKNLIIEIKKIKKFQTKLIATGMHYSKKHGSTFKEITNDGFKINYKINLNLKGDSNTEVTKSILGPRAGTTNLTADMEKLNEVEKLLQEFNDG